MKKEKLIQIKTILLFFAVFTFSILLFPSSSSAAILGKPPNNLGLVNYWSLNEGTGTKATDASGTGNTGTLTGGPTWVNGRYGQGVSFDGTDDYISISDASLASGSNITVSAWVNQTSAKYVGLVVSAANSDAPGEFALLLNASGVPVFTPWISGAGDRPHLDAAASSAISFGVWHHLVGVYDVSAGYAYIYVDGVLAGSSNTTVNSSTWNGPAIGSGGVGGTTTYFLNGKEDDVRIYNRALTAAQVASLYGSGAVARKAPNQKNLLGYWSFDEGTGNRLGNASGSDSFHGTITGATWTSLGKKGSALSFDRSGDYVNMGGIVLTGTNQPFTMSSWVNPANLTDAWKTIMAGGCTGFDVAISGAGLQIGRNCGGAGVFYGVYTLPAANQWYHIVAVYDGTNINAYVNGVLYTGGAVTYDNSSTYYIGSYNGGDELFNGKIDEVYLWNRALSAAEIIALYTSNNQKINSSQNTRLTSGLVGLWSFNGADFDSTYVYDRSGSSNNGYLYNNATSSVKASGKVGQGAQFDGSDDYIQVPNSSSIDITSPSITTAGWVYLRSLTPGGANTDIGTILQKTGQYYMAFEAATGKLTAYYQGVIGSHTASTSAIPLSTWTHVALTYDGTNIKWYINGALDKTLAASGSITSDAGQRGIRIGGEGSFGRFSNAILDEVRVYNLVLSAAEVKQLYDMGR